MATHIHKPGQLTYYIVLNSGNVITHGALQPENCLDSPYEVETFLDKTDFDNRLIALGVDSTPKDDVGPQSPPLPEFEL